MTYATPAPTTDPTAVIGRRIGAFIVDVFVPLVIAFVVAGSLWLNSATEITNAGDDFCNRYSAHSSTIADRVYDAFPDTDSPCVQINDSAYLASADDNRSAGLVFTAIGSLIALNLFVLQGVKGASVGKMMLGLRVVRADGTVAGFGANFVRTLMLLIATVLAACFGIGWIVELIVASASKRHQRIGDMAASTFVVRTENVGVPVGFAAPVAGPAPWVPPAAGTPTWGAPAAPPESPQPGFGQTAAPTWGTTPAVPASDPLTQATPAAEPPPATGETASPEAQAGWAAPAVESAAPIAAGTPAQSPPAQTPPAQTAPAQTAPAMNLPPGAEMRWDERWNAWLYWDPSAQRWLRHDAATNQWIPM